MIHKSNSQNEQQMLQKMYHSEHHENIFQL